MLRRMTTDELIGSTEALAILGCSRSTVVRLAASGRLAPAMRAPGTNHGTFLFRRADVEALAADAAAKAAS